ncbi:MAG: hypothetical protein CVT89_05370 [Candidatus Altiarchaeales archaeon HGW-Altiarchaeales-2]|nr:MAG: hypothetical protein CVT89_05370 [Candidatus Altiarchaeales archaeon HGW-Altiarchaeales-2]
MKVKHKILTGIGILAAIAIVAVVLISGCFEKPSTTKDDDVTVIKQTIYNNYKYNAYQEEIESGREVKIENLIFSENKSVATVNISITNPKYPKTGEGYEIILIKTNDTWTIQSENQT